MCNAKAPQRAVAGCWEQVCVQASGPLGRPICPGRRSAGESARSWTDWLASWSIDWPTCSFAPSLLQPSGVSEGRARGERLHARLRGSREPRGCLASISPGNRSQVRTRWEPLQGADGFLLQRGSLALGQCSAHAGRCPRPALSKPSLSAVSMCPGSACGRGFPAGRGSWAFLWWTAGASKGLRAKGLTSLRLSEM